MFPYVNGVALPGFLGNPSPYGALVPYGSLALTETSPSQSFTEPIGLGEIKEYLRLPIRLAPDSAEDDELGALISAAREQAEILQNRDLVRKQWDATFDYWPSYRVELRGPMSSVDLVQYKDSAGTVRALTLNTDYVADTSRTPGLITPPYNTSWPTYTPWPSSSLLIRFTSGFAATSAWWSDSGSRVKIGMKMLISAWFNNRMPFEKGLDAAAEYPYAVTACLMQGAVPRVR